MKNIITVNTPIGNISMYKNDLFYLDMRDTNQYAEQTIIDFDLSEFIKKSKFILDIGSHVGYHSIAYAKINPNVRIIAFEPQYEIYQLLLKNITDNNYADRIQALNKAVGHQNEFTTLSMFVDDGPTTNLELNYGVNDIFNFGGLNIGFGNKKIEMITIDSLNLDFIDYIKIDVEGAEPLVLIGAENTIKKYRPIICFEHLKTLSRNYLDGIGIGSLPSSHEILKSYGYTTFRDIAYQNVIAIP